MAKTPPEKIRGNIATGKKCPECPLEDLCKRGGDGHGCRLTDGELANQSNTEQLANQLFNPRPKPTNNS